MMKKLVILWLVGCTAAFSLAAQEEWGGYDDPDTGVYATGKLIYTSMITGQGIVDPEHMTLLLEGEVEAWNHFVHPTRDDADFVISGMTGPYVPEDPADADLYEDDFILYLQLYDNKAQAVVVEQNALYASIDELLEQFDQLMRNMFMNIAMISEMEEEEEPPIDEDEWGLYPEEERWRQKIMYVDGRFVWSPRVNYNQRTSGENLFLGGVGGSASFSWHYLPFMAVELGVEAAYDTVYAARIFDFVDSYSLWSLTIPLSIKYIVLKPRNVSYLMFEFSAGGEFNIPLNNNNITLSPLSVFGGFQYASKVGHSSAIILDFRLSWDVGWSRVFSEMSNPNPGTGGYNPTHPYYYYRRWIAHIGVGYKYGFIDRKLRIADGGVPIERPDEEVPLEEAPPEQ